MAALRVIPFRPAGAVAAACLALISVWRFRDGDTGWAALFAALALLQMGLALRGSAPRRAGQNPVDERVRRNWVRITVGGLVLSGAAVFWFPPLALVLAGLATYAALQARRVGAAAS